MAPVKTPNQNLLRQTVPNKVKAILLKLVKRQIFIPIAALLIMVIFNMIADPT